VLPSIKQQKIIWNLVTLEKCLNPNAHFQELSVQSEFFFQRMLDDIMKDTSPSLYYCTKLMRRGPSAFTQFIDILIETKQIALWICFCTLPRNSIKTGIFFVWQQQS
jgi:hypothetical protein